MIQRPKIFSPGTYEVEIVSIFTKRSMRGNDYIELTIKDRQKQLQHKFPIFYNSYLLNNLIDIVDPEGNKKEIDEKLLTGKKIIVTLFMSKDKMDGGSSRLNITGIEPCEEDDDWYEEDGDLYEEDDDLQLELDI